MIEWSSHLPIRPLRSSAASVICSLDTNVTVLPSGLYVGGAHLAHKDRADSQPKVIHVARKRGVSARPGRAQELPRGRQRARVVE